MFFKKKEKAVASEAIQEDGQRAEVPVGVDAQLSIKPVRKRRQRIKEDKDNLVTVEDVKQAVRKPIFRHQGVLVSAPDQNIDFTVVNGLGESEGCEEERSTESTVKVKQRGYFTVAEEEQPVQVADVSSDIASAFGIVSSRQMQEDVGNGQVSGITDKTEDTACLDRSSEVGPSETAENESTGDPETVLDEGSETVLDEEPVIESGENLGCFSAQNKSHSSLGKNNTAKHYGVVSIVDRLKKVQEKYASAKHDTDSIEILYYDDKAPNVETKDNKFLLANNKVYVNGRLMEWDSLFEVRVPAGAEVEIETGIGFKIPLDCQLNISCSKESSDKFYFKPMWCTIKPDMAAEAVTVVLEAEEGAYFSKVGRLVECQIVAS